MLTISEINSIKEKRLQGYSIKRISNELNFSKSTVSLYLSKLEKDCDKLRLVKSTLIQDWKRKISCARCSKRVSSKDEYCSSCRAVLFLMPIYNKHRSNKVNEDSKSLEKFIHNNNINSKNSLYTNMNDPDFILLLKNGLLKGNHSVKSLAILFNMKYTTLVDKLKKHEIVVKTKGKSSSAQIRAAKIISDVLKVKVREEYPILPYHVDIFIEPNICIEYDGQYWHNLTKDKEKQVYLENRGYKVFRIIDKNDRNIISNDLLFTKFVLNSLLSCEDFSYDFKERIQNYLNN